MNEEEYVPLRKVCKLIKLAPATIRKWAITGKIKTFTTPTGQRLYHQPSVLLLVNGSMPDSQNKKNIIYCRVSSPKQKDDLDRQIEFMQSQFPGYTLVTDCASGLNFQRKGLKTILELAMSANIGELVVAHKDRLARFGFELIEYIVHIGGGKITVLDHCKTDPPVSTEQELAEDLLSIIHVYTCRQMGKRRYRKPEHSKRGLLQIIKNSYLPNSETTADYQTMDGNGKVCLQQDSRGTEEKSESKLDDFEKQICNKSIKSL